MPLSITYEKPDDSGRTSGRARFRSDDRSFAARASATIHEARPIEVSIDTAAGHYYTSIALSVEEAEALAACLLHAASARRAATIDALAKKAA